jgi:hypothetical protein
MPLVNSFVLYRVLIPLWHGLEWFADSLPDITNLILVLVGVIMSLPKLAERIEDHAIARRALAVGCIVLGLAGLVISVHQRHQFSAAITQLVTDDDKLVHNTGILVVSANTMVTDFGILMPQMEALNARVSAFDVQIAAAKEKHDPRLAAELQAKADEARRQADDASKKLLLSMAPSLIDSLAERKEEWYAEDNNAYKFYYERLEHAQWREASKDEIQKIQNDWGQERAGIGFSHRVQMKESVSNGNYLREQMRRLLPETADDTKASALFEKLLKENDEMSDVDAAIAYLRDLSGRLAVKR